MSISEIYSFMISPQRLLPMSLSAYSSISESSHSSGNGYAVDISYILSISCAKSSSLLPVEIISLSCKKLPSVSSSYARSSIASQTSFFIMTAVSLSSTE